MRIAPDVPSLQQMVIICALCVVWVVQLTRTMHSESLKLVCK
jgi:cell division protein FtsL